MREIPPSLWRRLALAVAVAALAVVLAACGSSSGGSTSEGATVEASASTGEQVEASAEEQLESEEEEVEEESSESELEHIMRIQIYGKFGGSGNEFDVPGGTCTIVKINTTPAAVKAGGEAVVDHEGTASVLAEPAKGGKATAKECRKALESAIG